jgi:hypothetical protein
MLQMTDAISALFLTWGLAALADTVEQLPPLEDADRFPPAAVVLEIIQFSQAHDEWLSVQAALARRPDLRQELLSWRDEVRRLREPWELLRGAATGSDEWCGFGWVQNLTVWQRRGRLLELRRLLGEADYRAGRMPAAIPLGRFRSLP